MCESLILASVPCMTTHNNMQPGQMENLLIMLEEELNYSKKQSRSRINALMREADQARTQVRDR